MNILLIQRKQEFAKELKITWKEQGNIVDIAEIMKVLCNSSMRETTILFYWILG